VINVPRVPRLSALLLSFPLLGQVLERWFNNKPTIVQDEEGLRPSFKHAPLEGPWAEPNPKKARHTEEDAPVASALSTSPTSPAGQAVPSTGEAAAEQDAVTGADLLQLLTECVQFELATTWVPQNANCQMCGGYCFAPTSDVVRQLGVCGCVVATEMELADAEARLERAEALGDEMAWTFSEICSGTSVLPTAQISPLRSLTSLRKSHHSCLTDLIPNPLLRSCRPTRAPRPRSNRPRVGGACSHPAHSTMTVAPAPHRHSLPHR
jgi:hypothetical protein